MKYFKVIYLMCFVALFLVSCGPNAKRDAQKTLDSVNFLKGELRGYVTGVYKVDFLNNTYERIDAIDGDLLEYKVYFQDGEYTIDFNGDTYVLQKVSHPIDIFGTGLHTLKWKFNYEYYIEDIPHSY